MGAFLAVASFEARCFIDEQLKHHCDAFLSAQSANRCVLRKRRRKAAPRALNQILSKTCDTGDDLIAPQRGSTMRAFLGDGYTICNRNVKRL